MNEQKTKQNITKQKQKNITKQLPLATFKDFSQFCLLMFIDRTKFIIQEKTDNAVNKSVLSSFSDIIK